MPDITKTLEELDRLHAEATPGPWYRKRHNQVMFMGKHGWEVVVCTTDVGGDAKSIIALHNAYPSLRARIAELEAKAKAFDAIELGEIEWEYDPSCKEFAARRNCGKNHWATTLIEAIRCANGGETGAEFQS